MTDVKKTEPHEPAVPAAIDLKHTAGDAEKTKLIR